MSLRFASRLVVALLAACDVHVKTPKQTTRCTLDPNQKMKQKRQDDLITTRYGVEAGNIPESRVLMNSSIDTVASALVVGLFAMLLLKPARSGLSPMRSDGFSG
jgi:hypothetical protein